MLRLCLLFLLLAPAARASVVLPPDLLAEGGSAAGWQVAAPAPAPASLDGSAFVLPAEAPRTQETDVLPLSVVPDSTSWLLLLLGMAIVGLAARRRQRSVAA